MKNKTWISVIVGSIIIAAFGLGINQIFADPDNDPLSTQEVQELISESYHGEVEQLELDYVDGRMVYTGVVKNDQGTFEFMVDAKSGSILNIEGVGSVEIATDSGGNDTDGDSVEHGDQEEKSKGKETAADVSKSELNVDNEGSTSSKKSSEPVDNSSDDSETKTATATPSKDKSKEEDNYIGMERAKEIALGQVDGVIKEIELDSDDGVVYYEIEMKTAQGEAEFDIHAVTGEILSFSIDNKKSSNLNIGIDTSALIGIVEAKRIALDKVSGTVKEIELEKDDGRHYYDIEMKTSKGEVEMEIDARTGEIISIEYDD